MAKQVDGKFYGTQIKYTKHIQISEKKEQRPMQCCVSKKLAPTIYGATQVEQNRSYLEVTEHQILNKI